MNKSVEIIFEDDSLVAINKEPGMLSIPDRYDARKANLLAILNEKYGKIYPVHRIDRETSGIIIFAKNDEMHREMNLLFDNREIKKVYQAVVKGVFDKDFLEIDIPLMPSGNKKRPMMPSARGKSALTKVTMVEKYRTATLLDCEILTGRQHQIRVHLATLRFPLLVDKIYGENDEFYLSSIKKKFNLRKNEDEKPIIERSTLHSSRLEFIHPSTKENVVITAPHFKDFKVLLNLLKKY